MSYDAKFILIGAIAIMCMINVIIYQHRLKISHRHLKTIRDELEESRKRSKELWDLYISTVKQMEAADKSKTEQ